MLIDNGRSEILADEEYRETLRCIRCGACLNACPIYRKIGGHAYGSVYPGPIGALITPLFQGLGNFKDLPQASALCGACYEACPVKINIPRHLINLRRDINAQTSERTDRAGGVSHLGVQHEVAAAVRIDLTFSRSSICAAAQGIRAGSRKCRRSRPAGRRFATCRRRRRRHFISFGNGVMIDRIVLLLLVVLAASPVGSAATKLDVTAGGIDVAWPDASIGRGTFAIEINGKPLRGEGKAAVSGALPMMTQTWEFPQAGVERRIEQRGNEIIIRTPRDEHVAKRHHAGQRDVAECGAVVRRRTKCPVTRGRVDPRRFALVLRTIRWKRGSIVRQQRVCLPCKPRSQGRIDRGISGCAGGAASGERDIQGEQGWRGTGADE